jgi:Restriction endonuclease
MASYTRYQVEVRHEGLHKYRLITGTDRYVVERKAEAQLRSWDEMWQKKQTVQEARTAKEMAIQEKEAKKSLAAERTAEAEENLSEIEQTLHSTLEINDRIEWDSLLNKKPFPTPAPPKPALQAGWEEPKVSDQPFIIDRKWHHRFFRGPRMKAEQDAKRRFDEAHESWTRDMARLQTQNRAIEEEYASSLSRWEQEKHEYELTQTQMNGQILEKKKSYLSRDPEAVIEYCDMVLSNSQYPDTFPQEWSLQYLAEAKTLAIDYFLPSPENVPRLREIKYVVSKDKFVETPLQEAAFNKLYDRLLYQIALRTIHELYESDQIESIAAVVFNGWVRSIDKGTGKPITVCVLSVQAPLIEFRGVDLKHVDPKVCFKTLKGVGSSQLHGLSPIAPILQLNKEDKRFVSSYSVVGDVDRSTNLAALDWEDFEHLIREVFEKEFSKNGGEDKITQASRDGGVDAVAFDPDPIRGGKIVIQAKRYTNTVGVSAVRDLYGTVLNEGATKGILVTTADYGPDAYAFAKDKPLTLLSGSNLLHLLERHGHKATIDLKAAKQILADEKAEGNA